MMLVIGIDGKCQNIFCFGGFKRLAQDKIDGLDANTVWKDNPEGCDYI